MFFSSAKQGILNNRGRVLQGKAVSIPFPFPKLSTRIPGIEQGKYSIVTAGTKVGKSQLCDYLYLYKPIEWLVKNPQSDVRLKIFYFTLELSKQRKILQAMCYYLKKTSNISISIDQLLHKFPGDLPDPRILEKLDEVKPYIDTLEKHCTFLENVRNPTGIYKEVRKYAHANGHYVDKESNILNTEAIEKGVSEEVYKIWKYIPNDPNEYVIVITDHAGL